MRKKCHKLWILQKKIIVTKHKYIKNNRKIDKNELLKKFKQTGKLTFKQYKTLTFNNSALYLYRK